MPGTGGPDPQRLRRGANLCDAGDPWHAHEVWEAAWKADDSPHRDAWKALIQLAAALHHLRRGHPAPVPRLLARARDLWQRHGHHLAADPAVLSAALDQLAATGRSPAVSGCLGIAAADGPAA